jgi:hypothetical protein
MQAMHAFAVLACVQYDEKKQEILAESAKAMCLSK